MSHLQLTSLVTWHGFLQFADNTFMQVFLSQRHAVIRSKRAQFPLVSVSNDMCCSVVTLIG